MAYYTIHLFLFKCKYLLIIGLLNEQLFTELDTEPPPAFVLNCLSCTSHKKEKNILAPAPGSQISFYREVTIFEYSI